MLAKDSLNSSCKIHFEHSHSIHSSARSLYCFSLLVPLFRGPRLRGPFDLMTPNFGASSEIRDFSKHHAVFATTDFQTCVCFRLETVLFV